MDDFGGVLEEDLDGFKFESDAKSLQQILENRAISPTSLGYGKPKTNTSNKGLPSLTPAKNIPASLKKQKDKYEFFEAKNGGVFCRPRVKDSLLNGESTKRSRGFGRDKLKGVLPIRLGKSKSPEKTNIQNANVKPINKSKYVPGTKLTDLCKSEKKIVPFHLPLPRQSISERKAVPKIDNLTSMIPQHCNVSKTGITNNVRKELNFHDGSKTIMNKQQKHDSKSGISSNGQANGDSFDFAKPFDIEEGDNRLSNMFNKQKDSKSLAKMIMMRESLAGMPKESIGGLFRQSLSLAELDRLFEDDSTQSFENLETRLKTPRRRMKNNEVMSPNEKEAGNNIAEIEEQEDKEIEMKCPIMNEPRLTTTEDTNSSNYFPVEKTVEDNCESPIKSTLKECILSPSISNKRNSPKDNSKIVQIDNSPEKSLNNDTLVEIYEIEYSDDEEYKRNTSVNISALLQRSLSVNDLSTHSPKTFDCERNTETESPKTLPKSISDTKLNESIQSSLPPLENAIDIADELSYNLQEENEFLRQAQEDLEKYRQEQVSWQNDNNFPLLNTLPNTAQKILIMFLFNFA